MSNDLPEKKGEGRTLKAKRVACAKTGEISKHCVIGNYVILWGKEEHELWSGGQMADDSSGICER